MTSHLAAFEDENPLSPLGERARVRGCFHGRFCTDRNKALGILSEAVKSNAMKKIVMQQGGEKLINLLKLKQPNNHDLAYLTLKRISDQDFGEYNVSAAKIERNVSNVIIRIMGRNDDRKIFMRWPCPKRKTTAVQSNVQPH